MKITLPLAELLLRGFLRRDAEVLRKSHISAALCSRGKAVCCPQLSKTDGESHFLKDRHKIKQLLQYVLYKLAPGNVLVILNVCYVLF